MPPKMNRCEDCGKLFAAAPEKNICGVCARNRMSHSERVREAVNEQGLEAPHDIALATGIPVDDVLSILNQLELPRKDVAPDARCARCKRDEATQGSPFCSECRMALDQQFGEAARILEEKIAMAQRKQPSNKPGSRMGTREALDKKRLRTTDQGHGHFRR